MNAALWGITLDLKLDVASNSKLQCHFLFIQNHNAKYFSLAMTVELTMGQNKFQGLDCRQMVYFKVKGHGKDTVCLQMT